MLIHLSRPSLNMIFAVYQAAAAPNMDQKNSCIGFLLKFLGDEPSAHPPALFVSYQPRLLDREKRVLPCGTGGTFVEGIADNVEDFHLRRSFNNRRKYLNYVSVSASAVGICVFCHVPKTHQEGLGTGRRDERDFILKALLLAKHRQDLVFETIDKAGNTIGFEVHGHFTGKHWASWREVGCECVRRDN